MAEERDLNMPSALIRSEEAPNSPLASSSLVEETIAIANLRIDDDEKPNEGINGSETKPALLGDIFIKDTESSKLVESNSGSETKPGLPVNAKTERTKSSKQALAYNEPLKNKIHPLFARKNWNDDLPDAHWKILIPVLRLASRFLAEESLWPFWYNMLGNRKIMVEESKKTKLLLRRFDVDPQESLDEDQESELKAYFITMSQNRNCTFEFNRDLEGWQGGLSGRNERPCTLRGYCTTVRLHTEYLDLLTANFPTRRGVSLTEARFMLARLLVHELNHALNFALARTREPFFGDQMVAEIGNAWESWVFGGDL